MFSTTLNSHATRPHEVSMCARYDAATMPTRSLIAQHASHLSRYERAALRTARVAARVAARATGATRGTREPSQRAQVSAGSLHGRPRGARRAEGVRAMSVPLLTQPTPSERAGWVSEGTVGCCGFRERAGAEREATPTN